MAALVRFGARGGGHDIDRHVTKHQKLKNAQNKPHT